MTSSETESTPDRKDAIVGFAFSIAMLGVGFFLGFRAATKNEERETPRGQVVVTRDEFNDFLNKSGFGPIDWRSNPEVKDAIVLTRHEWDRIVARAESNLVSSLGPQAREAYEIELARSLARKRARE